MFTTSKHDSIEVTDEVSRIEGEFKQRIQNARNEIGAKFKQFYAKLSEEEMRLLTKLDEIQSDTMQMFRKSSVALLEITQAKEHILGTFKINITSQSLLKKNLEMYDKEIDEIKANSKIDKTIKLVWKIDSFSFENLCEINKLTLPTEQIYRCKQPPPIYQRAFSNYEQSRDEPLYGNISGNSSSADPSKWQCPHCTVINSIKNNICEVCNRTPGYKLQKIPPASAPVKYCRRCNATNHAQERY